MLKRNILSFLLVTVWITASAQVNQKGAGAVPDEPVVSPGKTYCIISGISRYQHVKSLHFADNDALSMRNFMMSEAGGKLDSTQILMFLNEKATASNIWIQSMKWIKEKNLQSGDRLLVYLSGHGDAVSPEEYYYLAHDCDPGNDKENYAVGGTIPIDRLKNRFKTLVSTGVTVIFVLDACRTNELPGGSGGISSFAQGILNERSGELSLLSTGPGSVSIESGEYGGGHGLFTFILLEALYGKADKNQDGIVSFREVEKYVKENVEAMAEKKEILQIPEFCCSEHYTVPLFKVNKQAMAQYEKDLKNKSEQNPVEEYEMAHKGITGKKTKDTSILGLYQNFNYQLQQGHLRGDGSAEYFLLKMEENLASENLLEKARMDLSIALLDQAQGAVNAAVRGDKYIYTTLYPGRALSAGLNDSWSPAPRYDSTDARQFIESEQALSEALKRLDAELLPEQIKTRQLFLKVMSARPGPARDTMIRRMVEETYASDSGSAFFYQAVGIWQAKSGNTDSALKLFTKAEELAPRSAAYKTGSGMILWRQGRQAEAQKKFEEAVQAQPENEQSRVVLANFYFQNGQYEKAAEVLRYEFRNPKILELVYFQRGVAAHEAGDLEAARGFYKRALGFNSANPDYFFYLALTYDQAKDYAQAEHYYQWCLKIDPIYLPAHINLGALYVQVDKLDLAFRHLQFAFEMDPENFKTMNNLGMYFMKKGDLNAAEKYLLASIEHAPDQYNERVIRNLVTLYYLMKDEGEATRWFKKLK